MVHNGIEYADMQLIAESYDLLRNGAGLEVAEIAQVFKEWNEGDLESFLIEITARVLEKVDESTGSRSWTSSSTKPPRRARAAGPRRTGSSSACR
jgi:6-phosphogluconate dehydrogenase